MGAEGVADDDIAASCGGKNWVQGFLVTTIPAFCSDERRIQLRLLTFQLARVVCQGVRCDEFGFAVEERLDLISAIASRIRCTVVCPVSSCTGVTLRIVCRRTGKFAVCD